jgi:hypothetical protein
MKSSTDFTTEEIRFSFRHKDSSIKVKMKYKKTENGFYANKVRLLQDKYNEIIIVYRTNIELIFTPNASIFQLFTKKLEKHLDSIRKNTTFATKIPVSDTQKSVLTKDS